MDFSIWLALFALFFSGGLTPGPAVMLVTSSSLKYGFAPAMVAGIGISTANLVWIALAVSGAAALAATFPQFFMILKLAGVLFILWLAWGMIANSESMNITARVIPRRRVLFIKGVGLQLANPNALVFFGGLLPAYINSNTPLIPQIIVIIATVTVTELAGLGIYAIAAERLSKNFQSANFVKWFSRLAALLMVGSALFALYVTLFPPQN